MRAFFTLVNSMKPKQRLMFFACALIGIQTWVAYAIYFRALNEEHHMHHLIQSFYPKEFSSVV